ncbi:hypothetical protein PR003_g18067 [Phytophthora rubi]|uniref:Ubiquitin-like domain-containing protein n=1 Tax=Phytophthora rubi TaxID=129364 RepID=A0A6A3KIV2_9STRA|nr:hypothetical protein PR002_g17540 [Phytophthora rubi]KAE9006682.1 hypothetical protein PR001_g17150 [Phytophthora rubi]KAE9319071.1 hypothetical protein PR003_g18067 [Phytophthora rubi]
MPQPVLDLGLLSAASKEATVERGEESKFDDVMALQEEPIKITFLLPDDSTVTSEFKKGHTIAVLKAFLEDEYELKQEQTQLCLDGTMLLDPFSLTDFPCVLEASAIDIQVRHSSSDDAKSRK